MWPELVKGKAAQEPWNPLYLAVFTQQFPGESLAAKRMVAGF